jgi:hypothetical protein
VGGGVETWGAGDGEAGAHSVPAAPAVASTRASTPQRRDRACSLAQEHAP